jgi:hypothetical protein
MNTLPKFKSGDKVTHPADLYGMTESVVSEKGAERVFYNHDGNLAYRESDLPSMREEIKWDIEDVEGGDAVLTIHAWQANDGDYGGKEEVINFSHYGYVVRNEKMNTIIGESHLALIEAAPEPTPEPSTDYQELIAKLDDLKKNWDGQNRLDANWVCVKFPTKKWREAKKAGAKKDYYWGWILWSGSVQELGSNFAVEVMKIAQPYGLLTRERQL